MKLLSSEDKRISAKEALLHPWIKEKESNILIPSIHLNRLKEFQKSKKLKKAALTYLATRTSDSDVNEEMKLFVKLDKNKDGYLTLKELREGMKDIENADEVAEILQGVDIDNNGAINYTEFIAATLDQKSYFSQTKKMDDVFKVFDRDGDGVIDEDEIRQLLS
jgi:calcium-dependent protein kinase